MNVRRLRAFAAAGAAALLLGTSTAAGFAAPAPGPVITVYKTPTCGCCRNWVEHLRKHGYRVVTRDVQDVQPFKTQHHVPAGAQSCHTAVVNGYVVEGHVPADVIDRLLRERPKVAGVAVPGMPMGSPGMEMGGHAEHYDVLSFDRNGRTAVYARR